MRRSRRTSELVMRSVGEPAALATGATCGSDSFMEIVQSCVGSTFQEASSDRRIVVLFADRLAVSYADASGMTSRPALHFFRVGLSSPSFGHLGGVGFARTGYPRTYTQSSFLAG